MKPPEKPQMAPYFIDRNNYVQTFFHLLSRRDFIQFVGDTFSDYGTGKTTVLSTLYYEIENHHPELKPLWMSLDQYSMYYQNPQFTEPTRPLAKLRLRTQNLIGYMDLLVELANDALPQLPDFSGLVQRHAFDVIREYFGSGWDAKSSAADAWKQIIEQVEAGRIVQKTAEAAINITVRRLTQDFLGYFNPSLRADQNVVLFADDYCWISDQPLGDWVLNDLIGHMKNTWVIVSRTTEKLDMRPETRRQIENLRLSNFTPEEVATYIQKRLGLEFLPPMLVENIYHFSKGHAQTVSLVTDLLQTISAANPDALAEFPRLKKGDYDETIPELLMRLIDDTAQPWLREALGLGIVARRFDADLLYRVLMNNDEFVAVLEAGLQYEEDVEHEPIPDGPVSQHESGDQEDGEQHEDAPHPLEFRIKERILHEVTRFSFVEQHHDSVGIYYAFHNNMRDAVNTYLAINRPDWVAELHQKLTEAYSEILGGYEEQDPAERFVALYRYEDPAWQRNVSEWLYHVAQINDQHKADLEFLNIYFTAFQWWEYYLTFPFCEHILKHWGWIQGEEARSDLYKLVIEFHEVYPRGLYRDVKGDLRWDRVQTLILDIANAFHLLDTDPAELSVKHRALRIALSEVYTVSLRCKREPDYAAAEAQYRESAQIAAEDGDHYNQSYQTCFLGDLLVEMGRHDEAFDAAAEVNQLIDTDGLFDIKKDYEVLTLSYRVMAEARLLQGRYDEVAPYYVRSSMCGYAQNFIQLQPPDPYTVKWYSDNIRWTARQLIEVAQANDVFAEIIPICHAIHAKWESFWRENGCPVEAAEVDEIVEQGNITRLQAYLAPPAPDLRPGGYSTALLQDEHNRIAALFGISDDDTSEDVETEE